MTAAWAGTILAVLAGAGLFAIVFFTAAAITGRRARRERALERAWKPDDDPLPLRYRLLSERRYLEAKLPREHDDGEAAVERRRAILTRIAEIDRQLEGR